jgi:PPOX class probable F420-dependent enzyme
MFLASGVPREELAIPGLPLPPEIDALLARPNYAVVATVRPDGTPHSAVTWYDWDNGRVLLTLDAARVRLRHLRLNPAVSITVFDGEDFLRHVTLNGHVVEISDDVGLHAADRMAQRYFGAPYPDRDRPRVSAWVEVDRWHSWDGPNRGPMETLPDAAG